MTFRKECRLELSKYARFRKKDKRKVKKGTGQEERDERKEEIKRTCHIFMF
jgi:hypothetical protein